MFDNQTVSENSIKEALQHFLAHKHQVQPEQIEINTLDEKILRFTIQQDPENDSKAGVQTESKTILAELALWLLDHQNISKMDGFYAILGLRKDDISEKFGYWLASQIPNDDLQNLSYRMYTEPISEDFGYALDYVIPDQYPELHSDIRVEVEDTIRDFLYPDAIYQLIPEGTWIEILQQEPLPKLNILLEQFLQYLEENVDMPETIAELREKHRVSICIEAIKELPQMAAKTEISLDVYTWLIEKTLKEGSANEEIAEKVIRQHEMETRLQTVIANLKEAHARAGKNVIPLTHYPKQQGLQVIRDSIAQNLTAQQCFEKLLTLSATAMPKFADLEGTSLRYYVRPNKDIARQIQNQSLRLVDQVILSPEAPLPKETDFILLNYKFEIIGICIYLRQGLYFDQLKDAKLPPVLKPNWVQDLLDNLASSVETE